MQTRKSRGSCLRFKLTLSTCFVTALLAISLVHAAGEMGKDFFEVDNSSPESAQKVLALEKIELQQIELQLKLLGKKRRCSTKCL
jgi:hypothetical protein